MKRTKYNLFAVFCFLFVCGMAIATYFVFVPRVLFRTQLVSVQGINCADYIALRLVKVSGNVTALFICNPEDDSPNATCVVPYDINSTVYVVSNTILKVFLRADKHFALLYTALYVLYVHRR